MDTPISELLNAHSVCALVLERYQIDYGTDAHRTLLSVCHERRRDPGRILFDCDTAIRLRERRPIEQPEALSTKQLLVTLITQHHRYLRDTLELLPAFAHRVAGRHGEHRTALWRLAGAVTAFATTMLAHIDEEERSVFPIIAWESQAHDRDKLAAAHRDHDMIHLALDELHELSTALAGTDVSAEERALFVELSYLEADTRRHLDLENNVLFRRFLA